MSRQQRAKSSQPATISPLQPAFKWLTVIVVVLVIVQAAMAGQWWFNNQPLIQMHGMLGNLVFLAGIVLAGFALFGMLRAGWGRTEFVLSLILLLLLVTQLGLGYSGRRVAIAASLHIPNGVLLACVCTALITVAFLRPAPSVRREQER